MTPKILIKTKKEEQKMSKVSKKQYEDVIRSFQMFQGIINPIYASIVAPIYYRNEQTKLVNKLIGNAIDPLSMWTQKIPIGYFASTKNELDTSEPYISFSLCGNNDYKSFDSRLGKKIAMQRVMADNALTLPVIKEHLNLDLSAILSETQFKLWRVIKQSKLLTEENKTYYNMGSIDKLDMYMYIFSNDMTLYNQYLHFVARVQKYFRIESE